MASVGAFKGCSLGDTGTAPAMKDSMILDDDSDGVTRCAAALRSFSSRSALRRKISVAAAILFATLDGLKPMGKLPAVAVAPEAGETACDARMGRDVVAWVPTTWWALKLLRPADDDGAGEVNAGGVEIDG